MEIDIILQIIKIPAIVILIQYYMIYNLDILVW